MSLHANQQSLGPRRGTTATFSYMTEGMRRGQKSLDSAWYIGTRTNGRLLKGGKFQVNKKGVKIESSLVYGFRALFILKKPQPIISGHGDLVKSEVDDL